MKKAEEVMNEFMRVWRMMNKYQDINIIKLNYGEVEEAFTEEKIL